MSNAITLTGAVQSSRKYSDTAGNAVHELIVAQGPSSLPVLVRRSFGATPTAHLTAASLERIHRPGQQVRVTGRTMGFLPRRALLELLGADHTEKPAPAEFSEAAA